MTVRAMMNRDLFLLSIGLIIEDFEISEHGL